MHAKYYCFRVILIVRKAKASGVEQHMYFKEFFFFANYLNVESLTILNFTEKYQLDTYNHFAH